MEGINGTTELAIADGMRRETPGVATGRAWLIPPTSMKEAMEMATVISKSNFVPKDYFDKPGDILCAIQYGAEIGLPPLQALQGIAVVNGRPCVWGDAALALVIASGKCADLSETIEGDAKTLTAVCRAVRTDRPSVIEHRFSVADAETAGLASKDIWKKYLRRMLQMRARAYVLRDGFADVLKGLAIREEVADIEPPTGGGAPLVQMPQAKVETGATTVAETGGGSAPSESGDAAVGEFIADTDRRRIFAECNKRGRSHGDLKAYLAEQHGIESTNQIPAALLSAVLAWATSEA